MVKSKKLIFWENIAFQHFYTHKNEITLDGHKSKDIIKKATPTGYE